MKRIIFYISLLSVLFNFSSCDFDPVPTDRYSDKVVWANIENTNLYLNSFYIFLNKYGYFGDGQTGTEGVITDGFANTLKYIATVPSYGVTNTYLYNPDVINSTNNILDVWSNGYDQIRRINEFIEGLKEFGKYDADTMKDLEAQIRFLRAYVYFQIMIRHNTLVILDKVATTKDNPLSPTADCWAFIEKDVQYAIDNLPVKRSGEFAGRLTKGAAYGFMSRVALFSKNWSVAVDAAQKCIDLKDENNVLVYDLNSSYEDACKVSYRMGNKESVLDFEYANPNITHKHDMLFAPGGDLGNDVKATLGVPTQEMVERYELATGGTPDWENWRNTTPSYYLLEPRFHATILYNGSQWKGRAIEAFVGGKDGYKAYGETQNSAGHTVTGYFLRKFLDKNMSTLNSKSITPAIEIRLSEVYLNLAEAAYRDQKEQVANACMKKVRGRVGLTWSDRSGADLLEAIKNERIVELAYEGKLYWDLRRWGDAGKTINNTRVHGFKITPSNNSFVFEYVEADNKTRRFLDKMETSFPLPKKEIENNRALTQLTNWN